MTRRGVGLLLLAAAVAVAPEARAQSQRTGTLVYTKDITDTSYSYCVFKGAGGDPLGTPIPGIGRIETSGSSTTVTAETAGDAPFTNVAVGDLLYITIGQTVYTRRVATRTSATQITVDAAIDTTGSAWSWWDASCGATSADGWVGMTGAWAASWEIDVITLNATSIGYQVQCKVGGGTGVQLAASTIATATTASYALTAGTSGSWDACRLGLKVNTDTGAQSVSAWMSRQDLPAGSTFEMWNPSEVSSTTLTEASATAVQQIAVPQTAGGNYADAIVDWVAFAADATNSQSVRGSTSLSAVNESGTEACTVTDLATPVETSPTGSLTCTTSCVVGLTDVVRFAVTCTSSLTQTSLFALSRVTMLNPNTATPQ